MKEKVLTLQELVTRLQTLCHDGFAQHEVTFWTFDTGVIFPEEIELHIKSDAMINGYIPVKLGE